MGIVDEDLRKALQATAACDASRQGGDEAAQAYEAAARVCFEFVPRHGLEVLGLIHLKAMAGREQGVAAQTHPANMVSEPLEPWVPEDDA